MPQIATPIPVYTTPVPAFDLVNELNNVINQINAGFAALSAPAVLPVLAWVASRFYGLPPGATPGTLLLTTGTIYAYPIYIPGNVNIKTLNIDVTTGETGGSIRAGIYADLYGAPGAIVTGSDGGAMVATSGSGVQTNTYATALTLTPGWYWLAMAATASSTFPTVAAIAASYASNLNAMMGADTAAHFFATSSEEQLGVTAAFTFGALPAAFPTSSYALNTGLAIPLIGLGT